MIDPLDNFLSKLDGVEKKGHNDFFGRCPAHNDHNPSLHVGVGRQGQVLIKCFAGCNRQDVLNVLGMKFSDLYPDELEGKRQQKKQKRTEHEIKNLAGETVAIHHRIDLPGGEKKVWWSQPDGTNKLPDEWPTPKTAQLPLYGTQKLAQTPKDMPVVVVEGEKAADALQEHYEGPVLGTVTGTSTEPCDASLEVLHGREVILWADNDEVGRSHMRRIAEKLYEGARRVSVFKWADAPPEGDAADHPELAALAKDLPGLAKEYVPKSSRPEGAVSFSVYLKDLDRSLMDRRRGGGITGIRGGISKMDEGFGGFNDGMTYAFAARTGTAKSLFAGQVAVHTSLIENKKTLAIWTEQAPRLYLDRAAHKLAGVSHKRSRAGNIDDREHERVLEAAREIGAAPLIMTNTTLTVAEIRQMAELHDPDILVVDHIQRVKAADTRASRPEQMGQISNDLMVLRKELDIPLVMTAQINRGPEGRTNKRPMISDIHWSGEIEQDCDGIVILYNPYKAGEEGAIEGQIEMHCDKFREGELWYTVVEFEPEQNWLRDIAPSRATRDDGQTQMGGW